MKRKLEEELILWKKRENRLPLLLRGARQVGKSYLVENFGKEHFQDVIVVDFERRPQMMQCFKSREPVEILKQIELVLQKKILPRTSLLFLDEIQLCPEALVSLRYFRELMPEIPVIAAGSLLEFLLNDDKYSFPVGRVEFLYLRPMSFQEYLMAVAPIAYSRLGSVDLNHTLDSLEHEEMLKWIHRYFFIGGMPTAIETEMKTQSLLECQRVHQRILQAYESDFGKYAALTQHKYLQKVFLRAPACIGKILKYSELDRESRSRDLKPALDLLYRAGIVQQIFGTNASGLPLHAHIVDHRFKLLFLDIGLLQTAAHVDAEAFWTGDVLQINNGMLAEQFVGQELIAYADPYQNRPLLFWEQKQGKAEVDYVIQVGSHIIPIEVKAGATGKLRSLRSYLIEKKAPLGIRISQNQLSLQGGILSIPLYLIHALPKLVQQALIRK